MQKILNYLLMAATVCGISLAAASCSSNDDNPATPDLNLSEKIIGKWVTADLDGRPALTNEKMVTTFISTTKAIASSSKVDFTKKDNKWNVYREDDVVIVGNKVTLTGHPNVHTTLINEYNVSSITDTELIGKWKHITIVDGAETVNTEYDIRLIKIADDYREPILGLWECTGLTGIETYNDANARLEFLSDGTYRYYRKDEGGQWQAVTTREFQDYFVDGTLLATRWKNQGDAELREWWEIASLADGQMQWTALRQNADGTTAQQGMTWKKIDLNIPEKIIGKWMFADKNGNPMPTNEKMVITFVSPTKAKISASLNAHPEAGTPWDEEIEADVNISGNKVNVSFHRNEHHTAVHEYIISSINGSEFTANHKITSTIDGEVVFFIEDVVRYVKQTADYSADIVGTWQGRCTSEGSVFDDGQEHRWQYNADGTYVYYVKDGDSWVPYATNTLNEYFVDGTLLCTRWIDQGQENREWWEITIAADRMNWTALRKNPDGTTFTATFEMEKVE